MTAPGNGLLIFVLTLCVVVSSGYAVGRIHQWHRQGLERDEAYRTGYDRASLSILAMMADRSPAVATVAACPPVRRAGRACGDRIIVNQRQLYPAHGTEAGRARV